MSRVLWRGAISFSLIHIPVTLQSASRTNTLDLDLLDKRDFSPVGYQRINKNTGKVVESADIIKGYKYEKDEYVVLSDEDFRLANVESTQTIDIQGFVKPMEIGPQYFETPYHLLPDARGERVYALLHDALLKAKAVAIGMVVIRTRQYACALFPFGSTILLNTLRYVDEIIAPDPPAKIKSGIKRASAGVTERETAMALKLVEEMRQPWDPRAFHDTYREDLMKRVEQKVRAGQTKTLTVADEQRAAPLTNNIVDLTSLLRKSLESRGGRGAPAARKSASRSAVRRTQRRAS